jgi:P-type conjugative transfer protein TrbJ
MRKAILAVNLVLFLWGSTSYSGGWPVYDAAGWVLKLKSLYRQIQQLRIMQQRVTYEIAAAKRMKNRLEKWKFKDFNSIDEMIRHINSFRSRARSIGYTYDGIADQFESFYGKRGAFKKDYQSWEKQSDDSIKDAMVAQGRLEKSEKHMADLDQILIEKRDDQDQAATLQAIGEINAIQSKQLADLSEIVATDARAKQSVVMEERSKQKELEDHEAHLMKDFNNHGKSRPLTHFPSLGTTAGRR